MALFTDKEIRKIAFSAVIEDARRTFKRGKVSGLHFEGNDILASVKGEQTHRVVISKEDSGSRFDCSCGFSFGGACEHVIATMLAVNANQAIQVGIDWNASGSQSVIECSKNIENLEGATEGKSDSVIEVPAQKPTGRIYLSERESMLLAQLRFAYFNGSVEFTRVDSSLSRLVPFENGTVYRVHRSRARETSIVSMLAQYELMPYQTAFYTPCCDPRIWILQELPRLAQEGFEIYGHENLRSANARQSIPKLSVSVSSKESVFDLEINMSFDGIPATLAALIAAVRQNSRFVLLTDCSSGVLPMGWLEKFTALFAVLDADHSDKLFRLKNSHLLLTDLLFEIADEKKLDNEFEKRSLSFHEFSGINKKKVPDGFNASMRPYQLAGYEWFYFLKEYRFGGCLADDMGLGKTVQALALLLNEKQSGEGQLSLIVVPTSLLFNWQREAQMFAPGLNILLYHGAGRNRYDGVMHMADAVLTSYGTVLKDIEKLIKMTFHYVIIDEAQAIKNPASHLNRALKKLSCRNRLALSGTPIENNLTELWSLFSFLNPELLGSYRNFALNYVKPIEKELNENAANTLRKLIFPFILRRTKEQVATDLPPKNEIIIYTEMLAGQRTIYEITRETYKKRVLYSLDNEQADKSRFQILEGLLRLRQICCHPKLMDHNYAGDSGKFRVVLESVIDVVRGGHRVLVFSQFVKALQILRQMLAEAGMQSEILTGATRDRQSVVDRFQGGNGAPVFFISLKAGGTGLNLTAADYVIHVDPWWNPSAETQASDRAHRIGQNRTVFIYKMITKDTIEERVLQLQEKKRNLTQSIIQTEISFLKQLTPEDVAGLFG